MAKDKTQLLRFIFIDQQIRAGMKSGRLANSRSMAAAYEVSPKSIMRDIDYLKNQRDAPIAYDQRHRGYYYTEENYTLPALSLNESDLFAICIAEKTLRQYENTPLYGKLAKIFRKIEESLPEKITLDSTFIESRFSVRRSGQTKITPRIWETVAESLKRMRSLRLFYRKPGEAEAAQREVDPYHIMSFQGEWYLFGYCHRRGQLLTFAISRIEKANMLKTTFTMPADFDFEQLTLNRFGIFAGDQEYEVKIIFDRHQAPYVLEREWHPGQRTETDQEGNIILSFTVSHLYEVKRWLLSWGSGARVLAPPVLRKEMLEELEQMAANYHGRKD